MNKIAVEKSKNRQARKKQRDQRIVGFIPARGGSKGIENKNIINVAGLPLLAHSVLMLKAAGIENVWVSTNDKEIGRTAAIYGARVLKRPEEFAGDDSPTEEAITHFLSIVKCDIVIMVQATSPMLTAEELNRGLSTFTIGKYDSVFSVVKTNDMLIWDEDLQPINYNPEERGTRQTRKKHILIESGGFYIFSRKMYRKKKCRIGGRVGVSEVSFWNSFQVDDKNSLRYVTKLIGRNLYG